MQKRNQRWRTLIRISIWMKKLGLMPGYDKLAKWPVEKRKAIVPEKWMTFPPPATVQITTETIASRGGPLAMRMFRRSAGQKPAILFIHGGGWIMGGAGALDYLCANLADRLDVCVASVDYRLAPDTQFPGALEDCFDALKWVAAQAGKPVLIAGDSAGGNLCAALALVARDQGGPAIAHQTIIYPTLDGTCESPSMYTHQQYGPSRDDMMWAVKLYLGETDRKNPLASPIHADLRGLPPAFVITADCDLLRDDGSRYAELLKKAGVPVRYKNYEDATHAFLSHPKLSYAGPEGLDDIVAEMKPFL